MTDEAKPKPPKSSNDKYTAVVGITDDKNEARFEPGDVVTGVPAEDLKVLLKSGAVKKGK